MYFCSYLLLSSFCVCTYIFFIRPIIRLCEIHVVTIEIQTKITFTFYINLIVPLFTNIITNRYQSVECRNVMSECNVGRNVGM